MVNPFDKTFFRFILGFSFILCMSFAILFFVNSYTNQINNKDSVALKNTNQVSETSKPTQVNQVVKMEQPSKLLQATKPIQQSQAVKTQINKKQIKK